jgi:hypothetical protein
MPCEDGEHLYWPGTADEVRRFADRPIITAQSRRLWPCAMCHESVDLLADELARREADAGRQDRQPDA